MRLLLIAVGFLLATPVSAQVAAIDGDTIRLAIRLKGLDTPEVSPHALCPEEHALGLKARARLNALLRSGNVKIRPVVTRAGYLSLDKYRRGLAVVTSGGEDVAAIMIRKGLARPYKGERRQSWCG